MKLVANLSSDELKRIKILIGEAFVTNELFHEFGDMEERRNIVMRYMDYYVDFVYHSKNLWNVFRKDLRQWYQQSSFLHLHGH